MTNMARTCVSIGFHLKAVRDRGLFEESGYETIWDYAADQFGLSMSSASRYMTINDMFSVGGNTPQLQDEYRNFSKSQLQEMITMPDEQRQLVTEDMTVKEIRQIKNPKPEQVEESNHEEEQIPGQMDIQDFTDVLPEESVATSQQPVSAYGLPARTYPPDSLIEIAGCGQWEDGCSYDCFNCHMDGCQIRQVDCYCVEAPMGNPFPCTTLNVVENIRDEIGDRCQFANHDLADHRPVGHEPVPCCKKCDDPCVYECTRSVKVRGAQRAETGPEAENETEKLPDERWNIGDLPQAKESLLKQLARVLVEKIGDGIFIDSGKITSIVTAEKAKKEILLLDRIAGGSIKLQNNVVAYAGSEIIEFYREDEDLGVCSYTRFATQVRKAVDEWMAGGHTDKLDQASAELESKEECLSDMSLLRSMLEKEKADLEEYIKVDKVEKLPGDMVRKKKLLVAALAGMLCDLDLDENPPEEPEQPEFPVLKNNDQRQEWAKNYKAWGLWYRDEHIDVNYYKFDFEDGTRLIAAEYPQRELYWSRERRDEVHYHLLEKNALKYRMDNNDRYDKQYCQQTSSMTEITDYLKRIRKGVRS